MLISVKMTLPISFFFSPKDVKPVFSGNYQKRAELSLRVFNRVAKWTPLFALKFNIYYFNHFNYFEHLSLSKDIKLNEKYVIFPSQSTPMIPGMKFITQSKYG